MTTARNRHTGRQGTVCRGPYRKYGRDWYDVVCPNDFGEPGRYSNRWPADATEILNE